MEPITTNLLFFFPIFAHFCFISYLQKISKRGFSLIVNDRGVNLTSRALFMQKNYAQMLTLFTPNNGWKEMFKTYERFLGFLIFIQGFFCMYINRVF